MKRHWTHRIEPLLSAALPRTIVEIGVQAGENTVNILRFCAKHKSRCILIDPLPVQLPREWDDLLGRFGTHHRDLSLNVLPQSEPADVYLIDGDHNWYTVYHELSRILDIAGKTDRLPWIMLHDVGWPYGRRDMYYDPDTIPSNARQAFVQGGLSPDRPAPIPGLGFNRHLHHAVREGGRRNGVLTAVEDFVREHPASYELHSIAAWHGLALLLPKLGISTQLAERARSLFALPDRQLQLIAELEAARCLALSAQDGPSRGCPDTLRARERENESLQKRIAKAQEDARRSGDALDRLSGYICKLQNGASWRATQALHSLETRHPRLMGTAAAIPSFFWWGLTFQLSHRVRLWREQKLVKASGLFDESWYLRNYPQVLPSGYRPLVHWLLSGWKEGLDPHPLFHTDIYLEQNPDVAETGVNPLIHYAYTGWKEGRSPNAIFDGEWYLRQLGSPPEDARSPLAHYASIGFRTGQDPSPAFSNANYRARHPELAEDGSDPLVHYFESTPNARYGRIAFERASETLSRASRDRKPLITIIAWDVAHNPLGRAYLLAEALQRQYDVLVVGPRFDRFGKDIWEPLRDASIPIVPLPGLPLPELHYAYQDLIRRIPGDVILCCKPRMPSLYIALSMKAYLNRPVILDIDDHELTFVSDRRPLPMKSLRALKGSEELRWLHSDSWTRYAHTLIPHADHIFVSNPALQKEFGGHIVPHARDERVFDPSLFDRSALRNALGLREDDRVLLFQGTPRRHKGVLEAAKAIAALSNPRYKLVVIGDFPDRGLEREVRDATGAQARLLGNRPFSEIAQNLAVADAVCVLQDPDSPIAAYQFPAKIVDAIAMQRPVLCRRVKPLEPLFDQGLVVDVDAFESLAAGIEFVLGEHPRLADMRRRQAEAFQHRYSYGAISADMSATINGLLSLPIPEIPDDALEFLTV